jgi:hypothetical protein
MKTKLYLVALFFLTALAVEAQDETENNQSPDTELNGYQGRVQTMQQRRYEAIETDSGVIRGELSGYSDNYNEVFNRAGYILTEEILYGDTIYKKAVYRRNTDNAIIERQVYSGANDLDERIVITRNTSNTPTRIRTYDGSGEMTSEVVQTLNAKGWVAERVEKSNGIQYAYSTMEYDLDGNMTVLNSYNQEKELVFRYVMSYDSVGQRIQTSIYDDLELLANRTETIYDSTGNVIRETIFNFKGQPVERSEFIFDSRGNLVDRKFFEGNPLKLVEQEIMKWNAEGYISFYKKPIPNSTEVPTWTYDYEYDEKGNWTRQNQYRNDALFYIIERKITYFE